MATLVASLEIKKQIGSHADSQNYPLVYSQKQVTSIENTATCYYYVHPLNT